MMQYTIEDLAQEMLDRSHEENKVQDVDEHEGLHLMITFISFTDCAIPPRRKLAM